MKILRVALIVAIVAGIGGLMTYMIVASTGWTEPEKEVYIEQCIRTTTSSGDYSKELAEKYCSCMLEKTMEEYSSVEAAIGNLTTEQAMEWRDECFESENISATAQVAQ